MSRPDKGAVAPSAIPPHTESAQERARDPAEAASPVVEKRHFRSLPADVLACFDGRLETADPHGKIGFTASLITLDRQTRAVTALLGPGEIYAADPHTLVIALWSMSRANQNLSRDAEANVTARMKLDFVAGDCFYQLHLHVARSTPSSTHAASRLTLHLATLDEGEGQRVPYATLTSGIRYELADRARTIDAWQQQVRAMQAFAAGG